MKACFNCKKTQLKNIDATSQKCHILIITTSWLILCRETTVAHVKDYWLKCVVMTVLTVLIAVRYVGAKVTLLCSLHFVCKKLCFQSDAGGIKRNIGPKCVPYLSYFQPFGCQHSHVFYS
jgi:hypothetical protein